MTSTDAHRPTGRSPARWLAASLVALACVASSPVAFAERTAADLESARQLYNQGIELRERGDLPGALEKFRAAHALGNTPLTGLELCKVQGALGRPVEAREVCLGVARIPPSPAETSRSQDARREAAAVAEQMTPRIASLRLNVTGVPPGMEPTVTVDGAPVPAAALGQPRAVDPGSHTVVARVGEGPETRSVVELREGESKEIALPVQAPPPGAANVATPGYGVGGEPARPPERSKNTLATVGFVVAGAGLAVGSVTGLLAMAGESNLAETCTRNICGREDHDELDRARALGNVSTAGFIVGGVGLGVAIYALLTTPSRAPAASRSASAASPRVASPRVASEDAQRATVSPTFGPTGLGVHGTF